MSEGVVAVPLAPSPACAIIVDNGDYSTGTFNPERQPTPQTVSGEGAGFFGLNLQIEKACPIVFRRRVVVLGRRNPGRRLKKDAGDVQ